MYRHFIKRIFDIILALIILLFWFIILIVIAPLIYFEDKGTIFYNAPRLGKDGKIFKMFKFRSMKMKAPDIRNEDGSTFNSKDDPRLTRIGKFIRKTSLDETPQLLNVLKGDMSFIGPRPDLPDALNIFEGNERRKLEVLPGITGFSQAYYRNDVSLHERFQQDIYYVDNLCFILDINIFFKTISTVLSHKSIYRNQSGKGMGGSL